VTNFGTAVQTNVPVTVRIDSAGVRVFHEAMSVSSIAPSETVAVTCTGSWVPNAGLWSGYTTECFTSLPGDEEPGNDTLSSHTLASSDSLACAHIAGAVPTVDGVLSPDEWGEAGFLDASNVCGARGCSYPPGSMRCWFMHDAHSVYVAAEMPSVWRRDTLDQLALLFDENNDGQWPTGLNEGAYFVLVNEQGLDQVLYRYVQTGGMGPASPVAGAQSAVTANSGRLVFEASIPIGTLPYKLDIDPEGDTVGLALFGMLRDSSYPGWWRCELPYDSLLDPAGYGKLAIAGRLPGVSAPSVAPEFDRVVVTPNPVAGSCARIRVPRGQAIAFAIYDAVGQQVRTVRCSGDSSSVDLNVEGLPAGAYVVRWTGPGSNRATLVKL